MIPALPAPLLALWPAYAAAVLLLVFMRGARIVSRVGGWRRWR